MTNISCFLGFELKLISWTYTGVSTSCKSLLYLIFTQWILKSQTSKIFKTKQKRHGQLVNKETIITTNES